MGRDVGGHAHRDAGGSIDQQVRKPGRQHHGFLQAVVVVGGEIHRFLFDVRQHVQRHFAHPGLGIPIGGGGMAVDGTEVTVPVHQRIPQREILRHTHHGVIHGGVAMGMIPPEHRADRIGALAVRLIRGQVILVHGVEDAAMNRLESVTDIRQGAGHNDRHGIFQETLFHFLFQVDRFCFHQLCRLFFHFSSMSFPGLCSSHRFASGQNGNKTDACYQSPSIRWRGWI